MKEFAEEEKRRRMKEGRESKERKGKERGKKISKNFIFNFDSIQMK